MAIGYRQWKLPRGGLISATKLCQKERYKIMLGKWDQSLKENKETLFFIDANFDSQILGKQYKDLNNTQKQVHPLIRMLMDEILQQGVSSVQNKQMHFAYGHPPTSLDHVYTNYPDRINQIQVLPSSSDHHLIVTKLSIPNKVSLPRYTLGRNIGQLLIPKLIDDIEASQQYSQVN